MSKQDMIEQDKGSKGDAESSNDIKAMHKEMDAMMKSPRKEGQQLDIIAILEMLLKAFTGAKADGKTPEEAAATVNAGVDSYFRREMAQFFDDITDNQQEAEVLSEIYLQAPRDVAKRDDSDPMAYVQSYTQTIISNSMNLIHAMTYDDLGPDTKRENANREVDARTIELTKGALEKGSLTRETAERFLIKFLSISEGEVKETLDKKPEPENASPKVDEGKEGSLQQAVRDMSKVTGGEDIPESQSSQLQSSTSRPIVSVPQQHNAVSY